ncbi:MAG: hypothetical protein LLF94_03160 [Chlamydiales bacterium]|nr:hypothetical protein [Chlamydiales bacterium]
MSAVLGRTNHEIISIPSAMRTIEAVQGHVVSVVDATHSIVDAVDDVFSNVPRVVKNSIGTLSFVKGFNVFFAIPSFINNIGKAIKASHLIERIKSVCRAALDVEAIWNAAYGVLMGLRYIAVLTKEAIAWTGIVNIVLFPIQIISVALDAHSVHETRLERKVIIANIRPQDLKKYTIKDITKACKFVATHQNLRKTLGISKRSNLEKRANDLYMRFKKAEDKEKTMQDGLAFIKIIERRIHTSYNLKVADIVAKAAGAVMAGISLFVPPNPVTMGLAGVFGVASLCVLGFKKLLLNKDPFAATRDVWHQNLLHKARECVGRATDAIGNRYLRATAAA